jgi:cyclic lactone autoinducer peptide
MYEERMKDMKKLSAKITVANVMALFAVHMVALGVSTQCAYIFHQPKLPDEVKKFRKF